MKKQLSLILLLLISFVVFNSCEEEKIIINIGGSVYNPSSNQDLSEVKVTLYSQKMVNGTWSYNYQEEAETYTDVNGQFDFKLEFNYNPAFKLEFDKEGYFSFDHEISTSMLENGTDYDEVFEMMSASYVQVHLQNVFPLDENDRIQLRFIDWIQNCEGCCYSGFFSYSGTDVNETFTCGLYGDTDYQIEYIITRNGNNNFGIKEFTCTSGQTAEVEILY